MAARISMSWKRPDRSDNAVMTWRDPGRTGAISRRSFVAGVSSLLISQALSCREEVTAGVSISVPYDPETLDPHRRDRVAEYAVASHFYEGLVRLDREMSIFPCLATRWVNPDLVTWLFEIRPGVSFHDGDPLSAKDVVFSLERLLSDGTLGTGHYVLGIRSVKARDTLTVEIQTERPLGVLLNKLALVPIIRKGSSGAKLHAAPNGTGPYRLDTWKPGASLSLSRNDSYWGEPPLMQKAVFRLRRSAAEAMEDLSSGKSDLVQCPTREPEAVIRDRRDLLVKRRTGIFMKYLAYDLSRKDSPFVSVKPNPFLDVRVRQAVSLAIDRKQLAASLPAAAVPAYQLVPPSIFGHDPSLEETDPDTAQAAQLLREAGYRNGFEVTLHVRELLAAGVTELQSMLGAAGIRVKPAVLSDQDFYALVMRRDPALILNRFGCLSGDASDLLDAGMHSVDEARHFGLSSFGAYSNADIDRLIEESSEIVESHRRLRALQAIMRRLASELVWIPLYFDEDVYALRKDLAWTPRADSSILAHEIH
jgi:peptide/nickel transport system substrate-binding protein